MYLKIHFIPPTKMCISYKSKRYVNPILMFWKIWIPKLENIKTETQNDFGTNDGEEFSVKYKKCVNVCMIEIN